MKCIEILKKHGKSVQDLASSLNITRQHVYRLIKDYEDDKLDSINYGYLWAFDYLFKDGKKADNYEFDIRMIDVKNKMLQNSNMFSQSSKEAFAIKPNCYITKNYIKKFEFKKMKSDRYILKINDEERYELTEKQMKLFLAMYDL